MQRNAGAVNAGLHEFFPPGLNLTAVFVNTYDCHIAAFGQLEGQTPFAAAVNEAVAGFDTRLSNNVGRGCFISRRQRIGCIGAIQFPCFYNKNVVIAQELFWKSDNGTGRELLKGLEKWAVDTGCQSLAVACEESLRCDVVGKLYERNNYRLLEHTYIKEF